MKGRLRQRGAVLMIMGLLLLGLPDKLAAYSVLSHETLIDAAWDTGILPLLRERFPAATPDDFLQAHAFAYGGSLIHDLGYYPRGNHEYSDLVHYVRSGDFVLAMIRDAQDIREYAFALGALAHYAADNEGHQMAVNRAVPVLYSYLKDKYGDWITYEDDPVAHTKTEFGFDVLEVAKHRFAPKNYHDFIGFGIAEGLLERAFEETYSVPLRSKLPNIDLVTRSFRYDVHSLIPRAVKVAWALKKNEIKKDIPGITRSRFLYNISRASYEREWGKNYDKPGIGSEILAFFVRLIPKVGPLRVLSLRTPTPQTEQMFEASFNAALADYQQLLQRLHTGDLSLPNANLDTGRITAPGTYFMQDGAYARLLHQLTSGQFKQISPELRADILSHLAGLSRLSRVRRDKLDKSKVNWSEVPHELHQLETSK